MVGSMELGAVGVANPATAGTPPQYIVEGSKKAPPRWQMGRGLMHINRKIGVTVPRERPAPSVGAGRYSRSIGY